MCDDKHSSAAMDKQPFHWITEYITERKTPSNILWQKYRERLEKTALINVSIYLVALSLTVIIGSLSLDFR